jgi:hypothetical protein
LDETDIGIVDDDDEMVEGALLTQSMMAVLVDVGKGHDGALLSILLIAVVTALLSSNIGV